MKTKKSEKLFKIFIIVALITLAVSIIIPVAWVFMASIKENKEFYGNPWALPLGVHLQNFVDAFQKANMGEYFLNSIIVTFLALAILLIVSLPAAYVLSRFEFKGRKFLNTGFKAGLFINVNYIVVPIFLMLLSADKILKNAVGLKIMLNNPLILALVYAATAIPFTIYILSGYFKTLPKAYEEAAQIDGCSNFVTMMKVMIPMAKPSVITVILFNFLSFWNEYIIALTLMPSGSAKTLPVGLLQLMQSQRAAANYGPMYAGLVLVMLPTLIMYILVQKQLTEGMSLGGLKD